MSGVADPRPRVIAVDGTALLDGCCCRRCGLAIARRSPRCARCGGPTAPERFGPAGVVWAVTAIRVATVERPEPFGLAYLDLDDGPRVLVRMALDDERPVRVGDRAHLVAGGADPFAERGPA